jgi:hypothetical protein
MISFLILLRIFSASGGMRLLRLQKHGLLAQRGGLIRIVPDVLSDYLLEQACVRSNGEPTEFADAIFERFQMTHFASSLRNLAELDWRITQRQASSRLLDRVWMRFFEDYKGSDASTRCTILDSFRDAAFFQPLRAIELAEYSMTHAVQCTGVICPNAKSLKMSVLSMAFTGR